MKITILTPPLALTPTSYTDLPTTPTIGRYADYQLQFWNAATWSEVAILHTRASLAAAEANGDPEFYAQRSNPETWGVTFTAVVELGDDTRGAALVQVIPAAVDPDSATGFTEFAVIGFRWFDGVLKFDQTIEQGKLALVLQTTRPTELEREVAVWYRGHMAGVSPAAIANAAEEVFLDPTWTSLK